MKRRKKQAFILLEVLISIALVATVVFSLLIYPASLAKKVQKEKRKMGILEAYPLVYATVLEEIASSKIIPPTVSNNTAASLPWLISPGFIYEGKEASFHYKAYFHQREPNKEGLDILYVEFQELNEVLHKTVRLKNLAQKKVVTSTQV